MQCKVQLVCYVKAVDVASCRGRRPRSRRRPPFPTPPPPLVHLSSSSGSPPWFVGVTHPPPAVARHGAGVCPSGRALGVSGAEAARRGAARCGGVPPQGRNAAATGVAVINVAAGCGIPPWPPGRRRAGTVEVGRAARRPHQPAPSQGGRAGGWGPATGLDAAPISLLVFWRCRFAPVWVRPAPAAAARLAHLRRRPGRRTRGRRRLPACLGGGADGIQKRRALCRAWASRFPYPSPSPSCRGCQGRV